MRRSCISVATGVCFLFLVVSIATAQSTKVDHLTRAQIIAMARTLDTTAARLAGSASRKLDEHLNDLTMVSLRSKNGEAEIHSQFADYFFVVQGHAVLVSGGSVQGGKATSPGEIRGTSLYAGKRELLSEGDVVHIPAGTPHQLLLTKGVSFIYFVIKVKDN